MEFIRLQLTIKVNYFLSSLPFVLKINWFLEMKSKRRAKAKTVKQVELK